MKVLQDIVSNSKKSFVRTATEEEIEAGTSDDVLITPLSLKAGIDALVSFSPNLDGGKSDTNYGGGNIIDGGDSNGT